MYSLVTIDDKGDLFRIGVLYMCPWSSSSLVIMVVFVGGDFVDGLATGLGMEFNSSPSEFQGPGIFFTSLATGRFPSLSFGLSSFSGSGDKNIAVPQSEADDFG